MAQDEHYKRENSQRILVFHAYVDKRVKMRILVDIWPKHMPHSIK